MTCLARSLSPVMEEVSAFGACGPAANTTRARQAARIAQAQRGRRLCDGRMGDVGLACGDGGWGRGIGEAAMLMRPGCPGDLTGTIQPASQLMSGQPDKRMSAVEQGGSAVQHRASRPDLGECGSSDAGECDLPCGSGRAEGLGVVGSVQIGDKGGCWR